MEPSTEMPANLWDSCVCFTQQGLEQAKLSACFFSKTRNDSTLEFLQHPPLFSPVIHQSITGSPAARVSRRSDDFRTVFGGDKESEGGGPGHKSRICLFYTQVESLRFTAEEEGAHRHFPNTRQRQLGTYPFSHNGFNKCWARRGASLYLRASGWLDR